MFSAEVEIVRWTERSGAGVEFVDRHDGARVLRQLKGDWNAMARFRAKLAESDPLVSRMSDEDVILQLAAQIAAGKLLLRDPDRRLEGAPGSANSDIPGQATAAGALEETVERPMSGYFMMMKSLMQAANLGQLEEMLGYREGRLTAKGLLVYRFLRVPEIDEFEICGSTVTPKDMWDDGEGQAVGRAAALQGEAAWGKKTGNPSFDAVQRRNARETMAVSGMNALVKLYPLDCQPVDKTREGYRPGKGYVPQWRLTKAVSEAQSLRGMLVFHAEPGKPVPWAKQH